MPFIIFHFFFFLLHNKNWPKKTHKIAGLIGFRNIPFQLVAIIPSACTLQSNAYETKACKFCYPTYLFNNRIL